MRASSALVFAALLFAGCSEEVGDASTSSTSSASPTGGAAGGTTTGTPGLNEGTELSFEVPEADRVYIDLAKPEVVTPADGESSLDWDLALTGYDVLTNSGPSGPGGGSGFGPLDPIEFLGDVVPVVPFLSPDATGGAFLDWWKYDNAAHVIWSRYHVYGIKDGTRLWKVQILSFYGDEQGTPVSALYQIRYAEVFEGSAGPVQTLTKIDGTAGGPSPSETTPSDCLDLASGALIPLTPAEAQASTAWHLCFRRSEIFVNGEVGGPKGVLAVDIDAKKTAGESLAEVKTRSAESELPRFESIDWATLTAPDLVYRGDRIVTTFTDLWLEPGASPPAPKDVAWLVVGADGKTNFLLRFDRFEGPTDKSPGKVTMRVKTVQ
jgi:hypothetical protein